MHKLALIIFLIPLFGITPTTCITSSYASNSDDAPRIKFSFPTPDAARQLLRQPDAYVKTASPFDRKVRMGVTKDPGAADYLDFVAAQVLPWSAAGRETLQVAINNLATRLNDLSIKLDEPVNLIHTTGKEESGAAYTRGNEIVFPRRELRGRKNPPTKLLAHEFFHVLSRQHPNLRDKLYALIGFKKANPIQLPATLSSFRITNPDAPIIQHVMELALSPDHSVHVAPMLIAKSDYKDGGPPSLFAYLSFRLMQVKHTPDGWIAEQENGEPIFHSPQAADFHRQIGRNTSYIIHPEEILADNFALIMTNGKIVDPWLTEKMKQVIKSYFRIGDKPVESGD